MAVRRAFILGAGASISHAGGAFPGISNFFKYAKYLNIIKDKSESPYSELSGYIERKYAKSIFNSRHVIDIEKVLTLLEIDINSGGELDYSLIRETILRLIVEVIQIQQSNINSPGGDYDVFRNVLEQNDLVISFNWDTLLDSFFMRASVNYDSPGAHQWHVLKRKFIYGEETYGVINFRNLENKARLFESPVSRESDWESCYLKMHGSIDWVSCQNELCPAKGYIFQIMHPLQTYRCSYCYEPMQLVIVPPVLNKTLSKIASIRRIWSYANRCIRAAEELVIWGYSLPPTDFYAENMLRMTRKKKLTKVDLINPSVVYNMHGSYRINRRFIERFEDVFGIKYGDGLELYESFEDWKNKTSASAKYGFHAN